MTNQPVKYLSCTPTYRSWFAMIVRCTNQKHHKYPSYGGRGITVCERWRTFSSFLEDMGQRPHGTTLDRIDNDGNYEPGNCKWSTPREQTNNTRRNLRVTLDGETHTAIEWSRRLGIKYSTLRDRAYAGLPADRVLSLSNDLRRKEAKSANCCVPGCDREMFVKAMCMMHYRRVLRHGSTDKIGNASGGRRIKGQGERAADPEGDYSNCPICGNLRKPACKTCGNQNCVNVYSSANRRANGSYTSQNASAYFAVLKRKSRRLRLSEIADRIAEKRSQQDDPR